MTIMEKDSELENTRVAWVGDGNNVLHDLMLACAILGVDCTWALPEGFATNQDVVDRAEEFASNSGAELKQTHVPEEAVKNATII